MSTVLKAGSRGDAVKTLQRALGGAGRRRGVRRAHDRRGQGVPEGPPAGRRPVSSDGKVWQALENRDYPLRAYYGTVLKAGSQRRGGHGAAEGAADQGRRQLRPGARRCRQGPPGPRQAGADRCGRHPHLAGPRGRAAPPLGLEGHASGTPSEASRAARPPSGSGPRDSTTEPSTDHAPRAWRSTLAERRSAAVCTRTTARPVPLRHNGFVCRVARLRRQGEVAGSRLLPRAELVGIRRQLAWPRPSRPAGTGALGAAGQGSQGDEDGGAGPRRRPRGRR